jgi:lysozyme family protein
LVFQHPLDPGGATMWGITAIAAKMVDTGVNWRLDPSSIPSARAQCL